MRPPQLPEFMQNVYREERARFLASLVLPHVLRVQAWSLLALDLELRHIPHRVREEMLGQMRFAWWREALDELTASKTPRRHPVVEALQPVMQHRPHGEERSMTASRAMASFEMAAAQPPQDEENKLVPHVYALLEAHQRHFPDAGASFEADVALPLLKAIDVLAGGNTPDGDLTKLAHAYGLARVGEGEARQAVAELREVRLPRALAAYRILAQERLKKRRGHALLVIKLLFCR